MYKISPDYVYSSKTIYIIFFLYPQKRNSITFMTLLCSLKPDDICRKSGVKNLLFNDFLLVRYNRKKKETQFAKCTLYFSEFSNQEMVFCYQNCSDLL